jgi:RNA polymerase sigma-70 factor (ECF subfamily)
VTELDELLRRGQAGDRSALSELIQRYQGPVWRVVAAELRAGGGDVGQCEDVCQSVFVKMVLSLSRLRNVQTFDAWLFQIARHSCRDHLRSQRWRRRLFEPFADRHEAVASPVPSTAEPGSLRLQEAIARLDAKEQTLVTLTLERQRSYAELAQELGLSISATKSRLFRTRARLGELLREGGPDDVP